MYGHYNHQGRKMYETWTTNFNHRPPHPGYHNNLAWHGNKAQYSGSVPRSNSSQHRKKTSEEKRKRKYTRKDASDKPKKLEPKTEESSVEEFVFPKLEEIDAKEKSRIRWGTIIPLIGGSSLGCELATGSKPLYHLSFSDFGKNESHLRRYMPSVPFILIDKTPDLPPEYCRDIDFITTVCPCAGLSMLNTSKGEKSRGGDAEQNVWMIRSAQFVLSKIGPKCFWGENAPGLFTKVGESVLNTLREIGAKYGYTFSVVKTSTLLHGIPQNRVRTFYFFWKSPTVPILNYKLRERKTLVEYLKEIPPNATLQDWHMTPGKATERFKPYLFVLQKEGLTHKEFSKKFVKGTITEYLLQKNLISECIEWLLENCPKEGFYARENSRTFIQYLEHCEKKINMGLAYWDDSPRFVGHDYWPALIRKSMITAVHPEEDRYLNVREMMHLMGLPFDFEIDHAKNINHIAQNVPVSTAHDWADEVVRFCLGKANMSNYTYMKQDNVKQEIVERKTGKAGDHTIESEARNQKRGLIKLEAVNQKSNMNVSNQKKSGKKIKLETRDQKKGRVTLEARNQKTQTNMEVTDHKTHLKVECKESNHESGEQKSNLDVSIEKKGIIKVEVKYLKSNLEVRDIRILTGEKLYKCEQCDKSFTLKHILDQHIRIHTGEKPFKCEQCDKSYTLKYSLDRHFMTHTGKKSYKCEQCDKFFNQKKNLDRHIKTHTGEKPYKRVCTVR